MNDITKKELQEIQEQLESIMQYGLADKLQNIIDDISIPMQAGVKPDACGLKLPMIITIKKDKIGNRTYYGQSIMIDSLFKYLRKKKIPFIEPKNKEGLYDKIKISIATPEQALNLLLWDKFSLLSKHSV